MATAGRDAPAACKSSIDVKPALAAILGRDVPDSRVLYDRK